MNFDKYAAAFEEYNDQQLAELNKAKAEQSSVQPPAQATTGRPFQRTHKPTAVTGESITARMTENKSQSALFPGIDPKLARFVD